MHRPGAFAGRPGWMLVRHRVPVLVAVILLEIVLCPRTNRSTFGFGSGDLPRRNFQSSTSTFPRVNARFVVKRDNLRSQESFRFLMVFHRFASVTELTVDSSRVGDFSSCDLTKDGVSFSAGRNDHLVCLKTK